MAIKKMASGAKKPMARMVAPAKLRNTAGKSNPKASAKGKGSSGY